MTKKQKLELTWIGKENQPRLEPRILIEDPERSFHPLSPFQEVIKKVPSLEGPGVGNMLIHGDNLLALKVLEQDFTGKVKCFSISPTDTFGG